MALSGTINGTCDNSNYSLTCEWSATQNITNNISTITAKVYLKAPSGWSTDSSYWDVLINGTQVTNDKSAVVSGTKVLLGQKTWTVTHTSSGTCSTTISFSYSNGLTSAGTYTTKKGSGSGSITLNTIPRTSSFTLSKTSLEMGASQTVTISRASSSFTHTVQYKFGKITTTLEPQKTDKTSVSFTPPVSLATEIPNATSGTCTVKVTTYNGSTAIGSTTKTFTLTVPSNVKPTVTLATTINNGLSGLMLSGKSTIKITPTGTGSQGSTISSYSYSGAGLSGTGSSKTTGTLNAGSYTVTVTVKDSRGRTNTTSKSFTVYAYSEPTCSISAYRTDSSGNASATGEYVRLKLGWNLSNPNSANTNAHTFKVEYKTSSATTWTQATSGTLISYSASNHIHNPNSVAVATTTSYNFRFTVTDSFGSTSAICTLSTINALLNLEKNGVGIGKIYERGKLDINGNVYVQNGTLRFTASPSQYARIGYQSSSDASDGIASTFIASGNNKWLRLKDDDTMTWKGYTVYHSGNLGSTTASGNRWGTVGTISSDGVMEVGKYIDFHESDDDTSNYALRITSSGGNLLSSGYISPNGNGTARFGYSSSEACTYISNNSGNWLRLTDGGDIQWKSKNVFYDGCTGSFDHLGQYFTIGQYTDSFNAVQIKRYTSDQGNMLIKLGASVAYESPCARLEIGKVDSSGNLTALKAYTFGNEYFSTHTNNAVNIGSSTYHFKSVYATNGTIQTSDGRYKYILENVDNQTCYELIKDMNLYGYSTLNKRIDEYADTTEISDELQQSSQEDMNLHMGFVAQEIEDSELAKYILIKDELEDDDGNKTGEHIYGIDNYGYTTAIHGALQHEIKLRENLEKEIEDLKQQIKSLKE